MRWAWAIILIIFSSGISLAQENTSKLLALAEETIYSDPQESIRIAEFLSNNSEDKNVLIKAAYILERSYYVTGDYAKALKAGFYFSGKKIEDKDDTQLKINVLLARILKELELNELSEDYFNRAVETAEEINNPVTLNWFRGKSIEFNVDQNHKRTTSLRIQRLDSAKREFKKIQSIKHSFQLGLIDLEIASLFMKQLDLDTVPNFLESARIESRKLNEGNYLTMKYFLEYGNYLFLRREHSQSIDSLKVAQQLAEKFNNIEAQYNISEAIADNYLAMGDYIDFALQNKKSQELENSKNDLENEAVNAAVNFTEDFEAVNLIRAERLYFRNLAIFGAILLLLLLAWALIAWRYKVQIRQYQRFIDFFENKQKPIALTPSPVTKSAKPSVVPREMEEIILEKLEDFENSTQFTNQDVSLSRLALKLETNTKYLSEVVNTHKRKNFNAYINELRINYIIDRLENEPSYLRYKISYLAEESGFSSHSVFATVFKQVTGIPPTSFISILKDKKEGVPQN